MSTVIHTPGEYPTALKLFDGDTEHDMKIIYGNEGTNDHKAIDHFTKSIPSDLSEEYFDVCIVQQQNNLTFVMLILPD